MPGEPHPPSAEAQIAFLEGRVEALERALRRHSQELRLLQSQLCRDDYFRLVQIAAGLTPEPRIPHRPELWQESCNVAPADVEEWMTALWASLRPVDRELPPSP